MEECAFRKRVWGWQYQVPSLFYDIVFRLYRNLSWGDKQATKVPGSGGGGLRGSDMNTHAFLCQLSENTQAIKSGECKRSGNREFINVLDRAEITER